MGTTSGHAGLLIQLVKQEKGSAPFKFFNSWLKEERFNEAFRKAWDARVEGSPM